MPRTIIIANWKMNPGSQSHAELLAHMVERRIAGVRGVQTVIAPPHLFLSAVGRIVRRSSLGAQDMWWEDVGPRTGEVSWRQLKSMGVGYVILGHSERRIYHAETDDFVNKKLKAALGAGITPIVCIGENKRHGNKPPRVIGEQLRRALRGVSKQSASRVIVAYEPVWAISTMPGARPDTPVNALHAMLYIRKVIAGIYGPSVAKKITVIYGGSVKASNIGLFLKGGKMQGALVGGASLDADEFARIIKAAANT